MSKISYDEAQELILIYVVLRNELKSMRKHNGSNVLCKSLSQKINELEKQIAGNSGFCLKHSSKLYRIGPHKLKVPVHILIEPDEDWIHISCLETPQIYGAGENQKKALQMFSDSFLNFRRETFNIKRLSYEFFLLARTIEMLIR